MRYLFSVLFGLYSCVAFSQDSLTVKLSNWKDGKKAAVVFTFDDWSPGHGEIVVPMFIKHEVPATFYVTTKNKDLGGSWDVMREAFKHGCEIGNHTETHPDLSTVDSSQLYQEVVATQKLLRDSISPKVANTFAFPYGVFNKKVLKCVKKDHIGSRLAGLRYGRAWPYTLTYGKTDYYQLQTFMARDIHTPSTIKRVAQQAIKQGGMVTLMYHSIYNDSVNDKWFGPIHETMLEAHVKAVKSLNKKAWITTFEKAVQYHKEKANTTLSYESDSESIMIKLQNSLNPNQFFEPVTIQIEGLKKEQVESVWIMGKEEKRIDFVFDAEAETLLINALPYDQKIKVKLKDNKTKQKP